MEHHIGATVESYNGITVVDCISCGFRHVWPLPDAATLAAYYSDDHFYKEHSPRDWFSHEQSQAAYHSLVYADWLNTLRLYTDSPQPTLLDIGCGSGILLSVAKNNGWRGLGVEPSPQARALCYEKGLHVVERMEDVAERYDAATLVLLLEHVLDPLLTLRTVRARLKQGAPCLVCLPNDFNPLQEVAQKIHSLPAYWICKPHVSYFTPDTLQETMEKAGFALVDAWNTWPVELALLQGTQYVGNEELGRAMYKEKMAMETALYQHDRDLLREMQRSFLSMNIGREIVMVGVKR